MTHVRKFGAGALLTSVLLLTACGGGGGSSDSSTGTTAAPTSPTPPVTPSPVTPSPPTAPTPPTPPSIALYSPRIAASAPTTTGDRASDALNWTNYRRAQLGLSALARDDQLDQAAAAHVAYLVANNSYLREGHGETAGNPGFTGTTPGARALAAGFGSSSVGENMDEVGTAGGAVASDDLIEAPYHRQSQLANFAVAGAAMAAGGSGFYVIDFGGVAAAFGPASNQLVVFPAAGETAAPIDWLANEIPNPLPDLAGQRVGFPVSIGSLGVISLTSFTLKDDKGVAVVTRTLSTRTDNGQTLRNYAFIVPLAPLASGTTYTASAAGTVDGAAFSVSWSFATAALQALAITPSSSTLAAAPGSTVDLKVTGGTGRYLTAGVINYGYSSSVASPVGLEALFSIQTPSRDAVRLTRGTTPCTGTLTNCFVVVQGMDSAGTSITLTVPIR